MFFKFIEITKCAAIINSFIDIFIFTRQHSHPFWQRNPIRLQLRRSNLSQRLQRKLQIFLHKPFRRYYSCRLICRTKLNTCHIIILLNYLWQVLFKTLTTHQPSYIDDLLQQHRPSRQLRSSDTCLIFLGWEPVSHNAASPTALPTSGTLYLATSLATCTLLPTLSRRNWKRFTTPRRMHSFTWPPRLRFRHLTDRHMAR